MTNLYKQRVRERQREGSWDGSKFISEQPQKSTDGEKAKETKRERKRGRNI